MFKNLKSQILWSIICAFITGIFAGGIIILIEYKVFNITLLILFILNIILMIFNINNLFRRLYLQDKLNSIWTHD